MIIGKTFTFEAAHWLPGHTGKCNALHGHTWTVEVELKGDVDSNTGMVIDFHYVSREVENALNSFDHTTINKQISNPTCENIVSFLWEALSKLYPKRLHSIKVKEGVGGYARLEAS